MRRYRHRRIAFLFCLALCLVPIGCENGVDVFPPPGNINESAEVFRVADTGPIIVAYASYPLRRDAPPDGVRMAVIRSVGRTPCSAATFYYSERAMAERWIREQIEARRRSGWPIRLIVAGHGLGGAEAGEAVKEILNHIPDAEVVMLLTVDAIKTGRLGSAASATGAAIVNRISSSVSVNFIAYDSAPVADGQRFWFHINYYQTRSPLYHGSAMAGAENHHLDDWTGLLNHANADDFAVPLLTADIRTALRRAMR